MAVAGTPWQLECENVEQRSGYLLTSGQWSDCTFVVGSEPNQEVVPAHKLVLAMASPVFEAMFYGRLSERNEPIVPIPDVPPEAFRALLLYIYTGNVRIDSFSLACNLWYGAKKYMLPHLVKKCNSYICSVLGPSNVCRTYEFARLFDEKTLTDKCIKIICTNTKEVLNDSSFEDVELNTVITVCSLDHLDVDSELDLFQAVERYAKAEQRIQELIRPPADRGQPSEELSDKVLPTAGSSQTSPAEELDSETPTEGSPSEPITDKDNLKEEESSIHTALKSIRFLSLSAKQFAEGPARSGLLTEAESLAIFMNIASADSPMPMPTGFSESRERRQPHSDLVDKGAVAKPRPKPSGESRSVAATKLLTPAEIVRELSSRNEETLKQATRSARHMTCADDKGSSEKVTQLVKAGGIPPLVAALRNSSTDVQYDAAWTINNIACVPEHTWPLVCGGAVSELVRLLDRGGAVAEQAAWALGNFASYRDTIVEGGVVPALITRMQPSTPSAPLGTYVHTYRMICHQYVLMGWSSSRFGLLSRAVPHIATLLELADEQVLAEACGVLDHLASGAEYNPQLFTPSLCTRLTALLRPAAATRVQTAALAAVGSMLRITVLRDRCLEAGCLHHIVHFLNCRNNLQVMKAAVATGHIMLGTPGNIELALDKGILNALGAALTNRNDECKLHAALAVTYLCAHGSASQLRVLTASAALEPYCWLLSAGGSTCGDVLRGLTNLLQKVDQNTRPDLLLKLRQIEVSQLLIDLQHEEDRKVVKLANDLLQTYFNN